MEKIPILQRCKICKALKFEYDTDFEKTTDKNLLKFLARRVRAKRFQLVKIVCPHCIPEATL